MYFGMRLLSSSQRWRMKKKWYFSSSHSCLTPPASLQQHQQQQRRKEISWKKIDREDFFFLLSACARLHFDCIRAAGWEVDSEEFSIRKTLRICCFSSRYLFILQLCGIFHITQPMFDARQQHWEVRIETNKRAKSGKVDNLRQLPTKTEEERNIWGGKNEQRCRRAEMTSSKGKRKKVGKFFRALLQLEHEKSSRCFSWKEENFNFHSASFYPQKPSNRAENLLWLSLK